MKLFCKHIYISFLGISLALICITATQAQQYNFTNFSVADGLPNNQINCISQDTYGQLWIGTMFGACQFDGYSFNLLDPDNALANTTISTIFVDDNNHIWFGTNGKGVVRFNGSKYIRYHHSKGLSADNITDISQDKSGLIWIAGNEGVFRLVSDSVIRVDLGEFEAKTINTIEHCVGKTFIGTENGLIVWELTEMQYYTTSNGLPSNNITAISETVDSKVWIGTEKGAGLFNNNRISNIYATRNIGRKKINNILCESSNTIWFCTTDGAYRLANNKLQYFGTIQGLPSNNVLSLIQDIEGNYWFGTNNGLSKYAGDRFTTFAPNNSMGSNNILCVLSDSSDVVWTGTRSNGVNLYDGNKTKNFTTRNGLNNNTIWSLYKGIDNKIWFGTSKGVNYYDSKTRRILKPYSELNSYVIHCILQDNSGRMYFGTDDGIYIKNTDGTSMKIDSSSGLENQKIRALYEDQKGALWIGTPKGVYKQDADGLINFNELFDIPKVPINTITQDHEGNYVFSSYNYGIVVYRVRVTENAINIINETNGLNNIRIKSCNFDNNRNLWIGTNNGVDRVDWVSFLNTGQISLTHFDKSNGYYGVETNASSTDPFGNVWFGSVNGLIRFNAQSGSLKKITPQVKLNKIQLFLADYEWEKEGYPISPNTGLPQKLVLEHNKNYLSFDYSGIYLTAPDEVQYTFMLEGFDDDWAPITRESIAHYANISPGVYTFKIRATANGRDWSNPISYNFEVTPPFWLSNLFYVIYAILGFTILTLILRVRTRKLKQKQNELQQKVELRTKELQSKNVELAKLSLVASKTDNAILIFDQNQELEWMNEGFTKLTGFSFDEVKSIRGKRIQDLTNHSDINSIVDFCIKNHKSKIYESKIATKDGHEFWASSTLTPIFDERNNLKNIVVIDTDITVRKKMEDQIKQSLTERGILLREIHHRVKNNLQIIISLFNLQSNYIADDKAQAALKEGQDRIKSMALIHEHFYQSDGLSKIDFDDYIYKLIDNLFLSYGIDNSNVTLNVKADAASLDIDTAVPCGLIINELVSNAIKHAFLPGVKGIINIEFKQTDPLSYQLIVEDNGKGLPPDFDIENTDSLGMQLIVALTDQLDGEVKIESDHGTKICINFKNIYVPENPVLA